MDRIHRLRSLAELQGRTWLCNSDIPVALCGVKDLVVVMKNNKLLVMKKNCSPLVKDAVHILEKDESNK